MKRTIVLSGASGLVGSALLPALTSAGNRVLRLVRHEPTSPDEIRWNPAARLIDARALADVDVVVNLAGESIGQRWTTSRRRRIRDSRVTGTEAIVAAIGQARKRPITLINASAVGYYGDAGDTVLDERSPAGRGFLADLCRDWETAAQRAVASGARVVTIRTGLVMSEKGGALSQILPPFRLGAGGKLGSGRQWMSWIDLHDLVRGIQWMIDHEDLKGAVNMVAPNPVTNADFTAVLGRALHRPAVAAVPAMALRLVFGAMANETLLASQRATPRVLLDSGFVFEKPELAGSLTQIVANLS